MKKTRFFFRREKVEEGRVLKILNIEFFFEILIINLRLFKALLYIF